MSAAPAALVERVRLALTLQTRTPLDYWHHAAPQLREATRLCSEVDEVAVRAPNNGGKTEWGTAIVLACCMGRTHLDGIPIPRWDGRVDALELARDYKQQKLSTQQTYLRLVGDHPHRPRWAGDDVLSSLRVRHADSTDDDSTWSLITFQSQENKRAGLGARADIVRGDEPPNRDIWHEARKSAHAGRRGLRLITYTPIKRPEWWWLREEYGDGPRGMARRVGKHWAEVRYSLDDNTILTPARKATLIDEFMRMGSISDARIFGDFTNDVGGCPFDVETLTAMLAECVEPRMVKCRITQEAAEGGRTHETGFVMVELYAAPRPGMNYYIPIDPSSGTDKSGYDPAGLDVYEMGSGDLVASYGGYIAPYSLGTLAAGLARQYNNAKVDVEVNDGWGINVLNGLRDSKYGNIAHELRELTPGVWAKELGFRTTKASRAAMVGAIQAQIEAYRGGIKYGKCSSRKHIECLLDCVVDETGKPVAAPGMHDERLITRGQGLRRAVTRSGLAIPEVYAPPRQDAGEAALIALIAGERDDDGAPFGQAVTRPRARPRM